MRLFLFFTLFATRLTAQVWLSLPDYPGTKRDDGVAVSLGDKAYFGTGLVEWALTIDFYELDLATNSWQRLPNMPNTTERQYACAFTGQGCFYVFGGDGVGGALNNLYKYDVASQSWIQMASKPGAGLIAASCLQFGDRVIIAGGRLQGGAVNKEVWEYIISSNSWQQKNNIPFAGRWRAGATVLHNYGYLLFGIDSAGAFRKELYRYDYTADTWTKVSDFPMAKGRAYAAVQPAAHKLFVFGGIDSSNTYYNDAWYYNDILNTWSQASSLPSFGRKGGMHCVAGDNFYYTCGITASTRLTETWMTNIPLALKAQEEESKWRVYPIPARELLTIELPADAAGVEHYSIRLSAITGEEVLRSYVREDSSNTIDIKELSDGTYILGIYKENRLISTKRVIKLNGNN